MNFTFLQEQVATGESQHYIDWLYSGVQYTIALTVLGFAIALVLGTWVGIMKNKSGFAGKIAQTYFEINRSIPLIAQLFMVYFVVPDFLPFLTKAVSSETYSFLAGVFALGTYMSGRVASQVSAGLNALPPNQAQACNALGMNKFHSYTTVLLPQVFKNIFPSLTSEAMNTTKNSAVVGTIGLLELSKEAQRIIDYTSAAYEVLFVSIISYVTLNFIVLIVSKLLQQRIQRKGGAS